MLCTMFDNGLSLTRVCKHRHAC